MIKDDSEVKVPFALMADNTLSTGARFLYIVLGLSDSDSFDYNEVCRITGRSINTINKYLDMLLLSGWIEKKGKGYEVRFEKR